MTVARSTICKGCWQNMRVPIAIRGPLSIPFRMLGIRISRMNPNLCTVCETFFSRVWGKKRAVFPATVLFADLRGYTSMAEAAPQEDVVDMLDAFYDECATAIWERDGVVIKFIGDAVLAIFNFPCQCEDHVERAVLAGLDIQRRWPQRAQPASGGGAALGIGIGIHTGMASIGELGNACKEFTITGPVVNLAARMQSMAGAGAILVSTEVYQRCADTVPPSEPREFQLKGIDRPVMLHQLQA
jgi:adenylate cyclase